MRINLTKKEEDYLFARLGKRIRSRRRELGMTQETLAETIGVSTSFVGHIERGSRKPSITTLVHLANALNTSANEFLRDSLLNTRPGAMPELPISRDQIETVQSVLEALSNNIAQLRMQNIPLDGADAYDERGVDVKNG
jgi:transcriptional regulator with XRE-family HTH domain